MMKLFGLTFGKEKLMPFSDFRDHVRLMTRRALPGVKFEHREYGFVLIPEGKTPTTCNLRALYAEYNRCPAARDRIVEHWLKSLTADIPEHTWAEAQRTLRPVLKNSYYLAHAQAMMRKNAPPDLLPFAPFTGNMSVIVMRELPGTVVAVTQHSLESWNVTFEQAMQQALNNLNMQSFPALNHALTAGGAAKKDAPREEVGLVFEGDHLTATWLIVARFRDYLTQRLQGDFVAFVPTRNRLTAIRADESGLIARVRASQRTGAGTALWLTSQVFYVSDAATGGVVSVYKAARETQHQIFDPQGEFSVAAVPVPRAAGVRPGMGTPPVSMGSWGSLAEPIEEEAPGFRKPLHVK